jgi:hypothetical protein
MKNAIFLIIIIVAFSGCRKSEKINGVTVQLIEKDDPVIFRKSVTLFDNSSYLVKTPLDTFVLGFPFNSSSEYDDMKTKAVNDGKIKDVLSVSDYVIYTSDSIFILAYYLETGKCFFYDKHSKQGVRTVIVESFLTSDPLASAQGRRFYINNKLFLETIDYMGFKKSARIRSF